jgi:transposase
MPYSSSLTDAEWEILEPLLLQLLPIKKQTRPCNWTKRELLDGMFYQLKNGCNWQDLPKDLPPCGRNLMGDRALECLDGTLQEFSQERRRELKAMPLLPLNLCFIRLMLKRLAHS